MEQLKHISELLYVERAPIKVEQINSNIIKIKKIMNDVEDNCGKQSEVDPVHIVRARSCFEHLEALDATQS
jgi:hypothetical protein